MPVESDSEWFSVLEGRFRDAMGNVAAPVAVMTTIQEGEPHGTTVSAFASLSMSPPMLMFALDRGSRLLARLGVRSRVGVNILANDQHALALTFAGKSERKFGEVDWVLDARAPRLSGCHAWVALDIRQLVPAGDHLILVGDVVNAQASQGLAPLTYHNRTFGSHASLL
jgi:flavin reductase (DIM6/NTAB) family NADH-FMN oxidoreductase RutF